jgi:hypothetical protein
MMELYIRIKNGQPFEHPIIGENFRAVFPNVDVNNLPPEFARFERIVAPVLGVYQKNQRCEYEQGADGVYRDTWYCDEMTAEEIKEKQNAVKAYWSLNNGYASWVFDEQSCLFRPPVPYPGDGKRYRWDEEIVSWVEVSQTPDAE